MLILLCALSVIAIHRIWHYEDIAAPFRHALPLDPAITPLLIAPCVVGVGLIEHPLVLPGLVVFACYPALRGMVWLYEKFAPAEVCSPCQARERKLQKEAKKIRKWKKRVVVFGPTSVIKMLAAQRPKYLFVCTDPQETARTDGNIWYNPIPTASLYQDVFFTILQCGNATLVTPDPSDPQMRRLRMSFGEMKGMAWVHATREKLEVPAHHRVVAPDDPLVTVIDAAQPPE